MVGVSLDLSQPVLLGIHVTMATCWIAAVLFQKHAVTRLASALDPNVRDRAAFLRYRRAHAAWANVAFLGPAVASLWAEALIFIFGRETPLGPRAGELAGTGLAGRSYSWWSCCRRFGASDESMWQYALDCTFILGREGKTGGVLSPRD